MLSPLSYAPTFFLYSSSSVGGCGETRTHVTQIKSLVLDQLSYAPILCCPCPSMAFAFSLVGQAGLEPATPCSRGTCASRLRYCPNPDTKKPPDVYPSEGYQANMLHSPTATDHRQAGTPRRNGVYPDAVRGHQLSLVSCPVLHSWIHLSAVPYRRRIYYHIPRAASRLKYP